MQVRKTIQEHVGDKILTNSIKIFQYLWKVIAQHGTRTSARICVACAPLLYEPLASVANIFKRHGVSEHQMTCLGWHIATQQSRHKQHVANILKCVFSIGPVSAIVWDLCCNVDDHVMREQEVILVNRSWVLSSASAVTSRFADSHKLVVQARANCMVCKLSHLESRALHTIQDMAKYPTYT